MTHSIYAHLPENFRKFHAAASRFADGARLLRFDDDRGVAVGQKAATFERYVACIVESMVRRAKDRSEIERLDHDIADAVEKLGELVACFHEDAALGRAVLPEMQDLKIGIYLAAMPEEQVTDLLHMLVAYPTPRQSHERTAFVDGLSSACVPVELIGFPPPGLIKLLIIIILILMAQRSPWEFDLVITVINALGELDQAARTPCKDCPCSQAGDDGASAVSLAPGGPLSCCDGIAIQQRGMGIGPATALLDAFFTALDKASPRCPDRCPARLVRIINPRFTQLPNGQTRIDVLFSFQCL